MLPTVFLTNSELRNRFEKYEVIGEGAYGRVYRALERVSREYVALKGVPLNDGEEGVCTTKIITNVVVPNK